MRFGLPVKVGSAGSAGCYYYPLTTARTPLSLHLWAMACAGFPFAERCCLVLVLGLAAGLSACHHKVPEGHATEVPGFFAYYHEELRARLRSQGQSDRLVDNPASAVQRSGDHKAIILLTQADNSSGVRACILSGGKVIRSFSVDSDSVDFDMSYCPVVLPQKDGPAVDRCGRFYSEQRNSPAAICRVNRPGTVLARASISVHDVFSSEDTVFVVGGTDTQSNERCLIFQVHPEKLELVREVSFPVKGSSEYGGLVRVVDLDERRGLAVVQPLEHFGNRLNECYLVNLKTGDSKSIGRLAGDFGFFLENDVLLEPRGP